MHLKIDIQRQRLSKAALTKLDFQGAYSIIQDIVDLQTTINDKMHHLCVKKHKISKITVITSMTAGLSAVAIAIALPFAAPVELAIAGTLIIGATGITQAATVLTVAAVKNKTINDCITATNNTIEYMDGVKGHLDEVSESLVESAEEITNAKATITTETLEHAIAAVRNTQRIVRLQVQIK